MFSIFRKIIFFLRALFYRLLIPGGGKGISWGKNITVIHRKNIALGDRCIVRDNAILHADRNAQYGISLGKGCVLDYGALLRSGGGGIELGNECSVNYNSMLLGKIRIGNHVRIAGHCSIVGVNHNFSDPDIPIKDQGLTYQGIVIEDDVWLGAHVVVTDGVTIGKGSVVGAGAVVNRDIPPYSVAVGVPAKVIRNRGKENG